MLLYHIVSAFASSCLLLKNAGNNSRSSSRRRIVILDAGVNGICSIGSTKWAVFQPRFSAYLQLRAESSVCNFHQCVLGLGEGPLQYLTNKVAIVN